MIHNKRTLRKRIIRGIRASIMLTVLIFSLLLITAFGSLIKATGRFEAKSMGKSIANELTSQNFLTLMNISHLSDLDINSEKYSQWKSSMDNKLTLGAFLNSEYLDAPGSPLPPELHHFIDAQIELNGSEIYDNRPVRSAQFAERLNHFKKMSPEELSFIDKRYLWLDKFFDTEEVSPVVDDANNKIGSVTTKINNNFILLLLIAFVAFVLVAGFVVSTSARLISVIFTGTIITPLTRLQVRLEAIAGGNLEDSLNNPITVKKPLKEIESLANSTNVIISKIREYTRLLENQNEELEAMTQDQLATNEALERRNNQLQSILDNVGQGFLTFGSDMIIHEECSHQCHKIFGTAVAGRAISKLLYPSDEEQCAFLNSVFYKLLMEEDKDKSELYLHLLPEEITLRDRHIGLEYTVVQNISTDSKKSIMMILTDITEKRILERKMEEEKYTLKMVVKAVVHYNDFLECVEEYKNFVALELPRVLKSEDSLDNIIVYLFRNVHNFKGNFSQYDILNLVTRLHEMETELDRLKHSDNITRKAFIDLINGFNMLQWLDEELDVLEDMLGSDFFNRKDNLLIDKNTLLQLEEKMLKCLQYEEYKLLLPDVRKLRFKPFKELLSGYPDYVEKLSERLEKVINPLIIEGDDIRVNTDHYREFAKSLVHLFRNSLDHGIETLEERVMLGKSELGTIRCRLENCDDKITLHVSDDGRGIDTAAITLKAAAKGMYSSEELDSMSEKQLLSLIFNDDFSLKEEVTELSGRGLGLYCVMEELSRLKGTVEVNTVPGQGTEFIFTLPLEQVDFVSEVSTEKIVDSLVKTGSDFISNLTDIKFDNIYNLELSDKVNLNTISALINLRGIVQGIIIISFNEALMKRVVKSFIIDEISSEELDQYMEDVAAECSNIILGNSIKHFGDFEDLVSIGTPTIVCYKGASVKYSNSNIVNCNLNKDGFEVSFSFVFVNDMN